MRTISGVEASPRNFFGMNNSVIKMLSMIANSINNAERKYYQANKVLNYYNFLIVSLRHFSKIFPRYKQRVVNRRKTS